MMAKREHWGSSLGFILAAAGSAVGLGNIWKFPYIAGENGGAAFIFIYLISIFIIGLPVMIGEIIIGRRSGQNPVGAYTMLSNGNLFWKGVGYLGVITGFLISSYYNVVAGWSLGYIVEALSGTFKSFQSPADAGVYFEALAANPGWIIGYQALFTVLTSAVVYFGVKKGIERTSTILMPVFFVILLFLVGWGLNLKGAGNGLAFLFRPDWSSVNGAVILEAVGHAFFTLSLGMGVIINYGSYLNKKSSVLSASLMIAGLDTMIALLAGIAIFTSVFAMGFSPNQGPGLVFSVLPAVFHKMTGGGMFGFLFFLLLSIAALTSSISMFEVITSFFIDQKGWPRHRVVLVAGIMIFVLGIPSALSFGPYKESFLAGVNIFDIVDFLCSNILLSVGGFFVAVFTGWIMLKSFSREEMDAGSNGWSRANVFKAIVGIKEISERFSVHSVWHFVVRYIAPVLILLVFLKSVGVI